MTIHAHGDMEQRLRKIEQIKLDLAVLWTAAALIPHHRNFGRQAFARNQRGRTVSCGHYYNSTWFGATKFCAMGALMLAAHRLGHIPVLGHVNKPVPATSCVATQVPGYVPNGSYEADASAIAQYNDSHRHSDVLALFSRAIAQAQHDLGVLGVVELVTA